MVAKACKVGISLGLVLALLGGCSDPPPNSGYVREKKFVAEYTVHISGHDTCYSHNKYGSCTMSIHTPGHNEQRCVGGCYSFFLEDCKVNQKAKIECHTGWKDVTESEYGQFNTGQHYPNPQ